MIAILILGHFSLSSSIPPELILHDLSSLWRLFDHLFVTTKCTFGLGGLALFCRQAELPEATLPTERVERVEGS